MLLREKALQGDARALDRLLELARLFNNDAGEIGPAPALPERVSLAAASRARAVIEANPAFVVADDTRRLSAPHTSRPRPA